MDVLIWDDTEFKTRNILHTKRDISEWQQDNKAIRGGSEYEKKNVI